MIQPPPAPATLTVSQLNRQVRLLLESHFQFLWVEGEISNFVQPGSGHWYFSLKDDSCQVRCAMFRNRNQRVRLQPGNGEQVRVRARVSLYEGRGDFQLVVEHMEPAGVGAMQQAFERLKQQLQDEGLFDAANKRSTPALPRHVGIITSPTGAAIRDIISVFGRRFPGIELTIFPVPVQGPEAAPAIIAALQRANELAHQQSLVCDALVLARGGGSLEDLWSFNDERVARAIAASVVPVVSAVGHEIDFTIADFVADVRAPTPSAAAELLSPDAAEMLRDFRGLEISLQRALLRRLENAADRLDQLRRRLRHPGERLQEQAQRLDELEQRLHYVMQNGLSQRRQALNLQAAHLSRLSPAAGLQAFALRLQNTSQRCAASMQQLLSRRQQQLLAAGALLHSLSPLATLDRGFAVVHNQAGQVVTDASTVAAGEIIKTRLARGQLRSRIIPDD